MEGCYLFHNPYLRDLHIPIPQYSPTDRITPDHNAYFTQSYSGLCERRLLSSHSEQVSFYYLDDDGDTADLKSDT